MVVFFVGVGDLVANASHLRIVIDWIESETAAWIRSEGYTSLRLVTASYHMPRSLYEFRRLLPPEVAIVPHPVFPASFFLNDWWRWHGSARLAVSEYHKYLVARFADAILAAAPPDARVWVHDFHLMLVPQLLRRARPELEVGFFLHIPFPSSEIYRLLPAREELLLGLLGADYIGFHTHDYARHFRSACLRVLGLESEHDAVMFEGRRIGLGVHPIGVDVQGKIRLSRREALAEQREEQ